MDRGYVRRVMTNPYYNQLNNRNGFLPTARSSALDFSAFDYMLGTM